MTDRIYHGNITPDDIVRTLSGFFNRGNYRVQKFGRDTNTTIQIATIDRLQSGGHTAISVNIEPIEDGISVSINKQAWLGVAASLGATAFTALLNPLNLLGRIDDIAQDIESLQLTEEIWKVIDTTAKSLNSSFEISERLRRVTCEYCTAANPIGLAKCIACGAPLGNAHPSSCPNCGYVLTPYSKFCPNCGMNLIPK